MNYVRIYDDEIIENKEKVKLDFTFLTEEQVNGDNQLDILKKYGLKCAITDFSILLGGFVSNYNYTSEGDALKNRTGCWWLQTPYSGDVYIISGNGSICHNPVDSLSDGCRLVLPYSSISSIYLNGVRDANEILEVQYGEYPQTVVDKNYSEKLENAYNKGRLITSGKTYTTNQAFNTSFKPRIHNEYEYKGSKYIRFVADSNCVEVLSDGRKIEFWKAYWVKVEPITWLVDEKQNIALSKNIIVSGIQFNKENNYTGDNFDEMNIKKFMDNYLSNEINEERKEETIEEETIEEETIEQILENGIKEMGEVLGECSDLINNCYQKKLKK